MSTSGYFSVLSGDLDERQGKQGGQREKGTAQRRSARERMRRMRKNSLALRPISPGITYESRAEELKTPVGNEMNNVS